MRGLRAVPWPLRVAVVVAVLVLAAAAARELICWRPDPLEPPTAPG